MATKKDKFNYFKVSDKLLDTDIKKSELWVYLIHCRHRGIRTKGYSIAGLNAVNKTFGNSISKNIYDKCIDSLIDKELINYADEEVSKGFYKSDKAIEVIPGKTNIQIPIELLDKKIITNLGETEIKDIIKLYSLYDPLGSFGGLDYNYIHAAATNHTKGVEFIATFGGGFSRVIHGKKAYKVQYPNEYIKDKDFNIDMNKYIDMKLFKLKPVVLEYDIEDEDINKIKAEVFKGLVSFTGIDSDNDYITTLEDNQAAIYVIEPTYPIKNPNYKESVNLRNLARDRAIEIYSTTDETTRKEVVRKYIYSYELYTYVEEHLKEKDNASKIINLLEQRAENRYKIDSIDKLKEEIELYNYEIEKEIAFIDSENIRISKEENRRRRHTTSTRLKELKESLSHKERIINNITRIENELIKLVPNWVIDQLIRNEENRDNP